MDNEKLVRYLFTIGKRTYINCFYFFQQNYKTLNDSKIGQHIPEFDPLSENNGPSSLKWKASAAIGIFKNGRELDAVRLCAEAGKLDIDIINKANKIIREYSQNPFENYQIKIEKAIQNSGITYKKKSNIKAKIKITSESYMRDPQVAAYSKQQANYKCELNPLHETFISEISKQQYVEAHHLIPMKHQKMFEQSLDIPENIIVLCPNCHRAIHNGNLEYKNKIIQKLYNKRRKMLEENDIKITLEQLYEMY